MDRFQYTGTGLVPVPPRRVELRDTDDPPAPITIAPSELPQLWKAKPSWWHNPQQRRRVEWCCWAIGAALVAWRVWG